MKVEFNSYSLAEDIPVLDYLKKRKLVKYFNRETAAGIVCVARLLKGESLASHTPFYYAKGLVEYEDFGLEKIVAACRDDSGCFSQENFISKGMSSLSPLTQFKVLYNMPLSFISIEHHLTGDNAVIYFSARGLLLQALHAPGELPVLLGAGRVYKDGRVDTGFALTNKEEIQSAPLPQSVDEAIEIFRCWYQGKR